MPPAATPVPAVPPVAPLHALAAPQVGVTILDLDRTVTRRGTYSPFLLYAAATLRPWRLALVPIVLLAMLAYRFRILTRDRLKEIMQRLMLGHSITRADVARVTESYADRTIHRNLHAEALGLIAREQAEGRVVILATAAHRFYAEAIARRLGVSEVVATESRWAQERLSSRIDGANCYGRAKAQAIAARLAALGLDRDAVRLRCYSDDYSDLPCFEVSDEPVAVNPSPKLARHARTNGWRIIIFRKVARF